MIRRNLIPCVTVSALGAGASAGEYGLRVFRDRDAWLAEATKAPGIPGWARFHAEDFDTVAPQGVPDFETIDVGENGVRLSAFFGARVNVSAGDRPTSVNGSTYIDVSLADSLPWLTIGVSELTYAWAAEFSGATNSDGIAAQFGDAIVSFRQFLGPDESGFLGFVTSSLFDEIRIVARSEGEEFSFDSLEWARIPAPGGASLLGATCALAFRRRRRA